MVYLPVGPDGPRRRPDLPRPGRRRTVQLADLDGDGKAEVYVLSEQEKQIGRSDFANGRLTFPTPLPISGEPVALDVADLDGDKTPEILYVAADQARAPTPSRCAP